jgi:hypothetical protein
MTRSFTKTQQVSEQVRSEKVTSIQRASLHLSKKKINNKLGSYNNDYLGSYESFLNSF